MNDFLSRIASTLSGSALPFERKGSLDLLREFEQLMSPITGSAK